MDNVRIGRMSGNYMGAIKKKLGLKGKTKPGDMIARLNEMKNPKIIKTIKKII